MINFSSFVDELVKIAQPNIQHAHKPGRRKALKGAGALGGAIAGGSGGVSLTKSLGPKARIAAGTGGAILGALGGKDVGGGLHRALG